MLRVALTGGIACGKSVVSSILREKGCFVHSADSAAHDLLSPGRPVWKKVVNRFGKGILNEDRTIERSRLAEILFSDPLARSFLNGLIHPLVMAEKNRLISRLESEGRTKIFVSEAALTIEAGFVEFYDRVIVVHCPEAVQIRRLMERDGSDEAAAKRKIAAQMPQEEKLKHADYTIDTSGSIAQTVEQTETVYARLLFDVDLGLDKRRRKKSP